jgi:AraC-like DNA-binding protein
MAVALRPQIRRGITSTSFDGSLGRWTQTEYRPRHLDGLVESVAFFDGTIALPRERVFPNGTLELIIQFDEPHRQAEPMLLGRYPPVCATGLATKPIIIEAPNGRCRVMAIRLQPAGAYALLEPPLSAIADLTVDLGDLTGRAAAELANRCADAATDAERVSLAADWIEARLTRGRRAHPAVSWMATRIAERPGVAIGELQQVMGLTRARLATLFKEHVGVTPKRFARIHRFRRALALVQTGGVPLSEIALRAGYYDQAHFTGEFRELAGLTPGEIAAREKYPGGINLPESME